MPEVNLGYAFRCSAWRQGYGQETCKAVLATGFSTLSLEKIVAVVSPENVASRRLAEKVGLTFWKETRWSDLPRVIYRIIAPAD